MAFIDKINPDVPEGRLLIRNGDYVLKDHEDGVNVFNVSKILGYQTVNIILIFFFFRCLPFLKKRLYNLYYVNLWV